MPKGMQKSKSPGPSTKGQRLINKWEDLYDRTTPAAQLIAEYGGAGAKNQESRAFGAQYVQRGEDDHRLEMANALASAARPLPYTMDEIKAIERKLQQGAEMGFDGWFANTWQFESDNPVMQRWARDVNPEYFRRREEQIQNMAELQKKIALMKLYGPRTAEDLELLYAIDTGAIHQNVLDGPLWDPQGQERATDQYQRGLFSPVQKVKIGMDKQRLTNPQNQNTPDKAGLFAHSVYGDVHDPAVPNVTQGVDFATAAGRTGNLPANAGNAGQARRAINQPYFG